MTSSSPFSTTTLLDQELIYHIGANSQPISFEWTRHTGTGESQTTTSSTYYYHYDVHGNTLKVTDTNQDTKITYTYDTLGNITSQTNPDSIPNPFTFMGASQTILDTETNLYFSSGYYNPQTGTLLQGTGSPAMPNPTSISTINSMSTSSLPEEQLLSHSITSATTAGSSSGGEPGSFSPPAGPEEGIANAGKRDIPDVTATLSLVGADNMPMYSDALIGAIPVPVIGGGGDKIQPTPPISPRTNSTGFTGGRIGGGIGKFAEDEWKGLRNQFNRWLTELFGVGMLGGGLDLLDAYVNAKKEAGDDFEDKLYETPDWLIWGEFEGKYYIFGYQFAGDGPRLFWGPRPQHPEAGVYTGKLFTGEEYELREKHSGKLVGKQKLGGFCFLSSWAPCFDENFTIGEPHSGLHGVNNTGSDIEILVQGGAMYNAAYGKKCEFWNAHISLSTSGTVLAGYTRYINPKLDTHNPEHFGDYENMVVVAYISGSSIKGAAYNLGCGEKIGGSDFDSDDYYGSTSSYAAWLKRSLYFFGIKEGGNPKTPIGNVGNPGHP